MRIFKAAAPALLLCISALAHADAISASGRVVDESGAPVPGAAVTIRGATYETSGEGPVSMQFTGFGVDVAPGTITLNVDGETHTLKLQKSGRVTGADSDRFQWDPNTQIMTIELLFQHE